jgi:hypothetical protein
MERAMDAEKRLQKWTPEHEARLLCKADGSQKLLFKHEDGEITCGHWNAKLQRWCIDRDDGEPSQSAPLAYVRLEPDGFSFFKPMVE